MANLYEFQERLQKLDDQKALELILFDAIRRTEKIALSLQKQQLGEGKDNEGNIIGTYSRATELEYLFGDGPRSRTAKVEGEPYNFEWTGDFFDNMFLMFGEGEVQFWSKSSHTALLVTKYDDIFGLDDTNLANYIKNQILPAFILSVRETLFLQ